MATHPSSPAPGPAEFSLIPQGDFLGKPPIKIVKPVVLVGSDEHCHLHLKSSTISRHHALIIRDDDRIYVCDLGSRTKILINGKEQRDAELANGDKVQIGKFLFKFSASRTSARTAKLAGPFRLMVDGQPVPTPSDARLILIGRTAGSDVMLVEESVSARHAVIFEVGGRRYLRDLDSRTGTFLNGKKTHQHEVRLGDNLRVGETELKLGEAETAVAEAAPSDVAEEVVPVEHGPLPVENEAKLPPAAEEEPIPLAVEPAEPAEAAPEHGSAAVQLPLDDPLPFAEPLPLESEPEPSTHAGAESVPEPVAADRSDEPLELEPEFPSQEETEVVSAPAGEVEHSNDSVPLKFEPEMATEGTVSPALAASGDASEDTHIDLEPPLTEAEHEPEPVAAAKPVVQATISADAAEALPELEPAEPIDLSDAPEPETSPETETIATPAAAEPEPIQLAASDAQAVIPEDKAEQLPETESAEPIDLSDAPEPESSPEAEPIQAVAEPEAVEPPPVPVVQATIPADIGKPEPEIEAAGAIDLSDAPEPQNAPEPPSSPRAETAPVPVVRGMSELDLLAEFASKPREEFKHVDFAADPTPEPEPQESSSVPAAEAIDLSDAPSVSEVESEPASIPEPTESRPEPTPAPIAAEVKLDDAPEIQNSEPEPAPEPEPTEEPAISSATINLADAPSLVEPEPETAEQPASPSPETIDLSDAPSVAEIEPEPISEPEPAEPVAADSAATINLSDAPSLLEIEPEPVSEVIEQTATTSAAVDISDAPAIPDVESEPSLSSAQELSIADSSKTVDLDVEATPAEPEHAQTPINFDPAPIDEEVAPPSSPEVNEMIAAPDVVQSADESISNAADAVIEAPPEPEPKKTTRGRKPKAPAEPKPPKVRKSRAKRIPPKIGEEEIAATAETPVPTASESPIVESPAIEVPVVESSIVEPTADESPVIESAVVESTVVESTVAESVEAGPSSVEPPTVDETPEFAAESPDESPADSSLSISEPVSTDVTLTAPADAIPPADAIAAEEAVEPELAAASPAEEPPTAPEPASPTPPAKPFMSVGDFAHLTGGTVNLDHSLGGMPVRLPDLPPAPAGFGKVKINLSGKASSPFSYFAKSQPIVFDDDPEEPSPQTAQPRELAQPESVVAEPAAPPPPPPVEAQLETVVTPAPAPHDPPPEITPVQPPPPPIVPTPAPAPPAPKAASPIARGPRLFAGGQRPALGKSARAQRMAADTFGQPTTAFDGLAPAVREADAFSNIDSVPLNDAAFGGARLSRSDDHNVPESPEAAARIANGPEYDFAEDEFWNRTDEDEGAAPADIPPAKPVARARPRTSPRPASPERPAAPKPAVVPEPPMAPEPSVALEPLAVPETPTAPEPSAISESFVVAAESAVMPELPAMPEAQILPEPTVMPEPEVAPEPEIAPEFEVTPEPEETPEVPESPEYSSSSEPTVLSQSAEPEADLIPPYEIEVAEIAAAEPEIPAESAESPDAIPPDSISMETLAADALAAETDKPDALPSDAFSPDPLPADDAFPPDGFPPDAFPPDALLSDAEPAADLPPDSDERSAPADNLTMESLATASVHSDETPPPPAAPPPRKRRRFRIPFLMPMLLVAMGLGLGAIWRFTPVQSQITGKMTFEDYNWTAGTRDGTDFEAQQRQLLGSDQTRVTAMDYLHRDHPDVSPGFLQVADAMGRVVSSFSLSSNRDAAPAQTVLQLSYSGRSKDDDRLRMMALLQSLYNSNAPLLDENRRVHNAELQAQAAVDDAQKNLDTIKTDLANLQTTIDAQPPADQMAKLASQRAELEKARDDAEVAVNRDNNALAQARLASPDAVTAAATMPSDPADSQLKQMRQQLADLTAELDSAHADQLAAATLAKQHLETTVKQFNDQLSTADEVLGSGSQLRQFVTSARESQAKARELINILIVDGEDLEKQLEDTRRDVEDLIQARQELKWADDPQLQQFRENLESAQHRYNANVGDGNKDPRVLDPLQKEIDKWTVAVKAREQQLGVDSSEIKVEEGLNNLVESLRTKLQTEKQLVGQILDPLEKQLNDLNPVVAGMPQAEQDLAHQLRTRLDALNDARKKYAEAVGEGQVAPSVKVTNLQKEIADLKDTIDRREKDLDQQKAKSHDATHTQDIGNLTNRLATDQRKLDDARSAYGQIVRVFEEKQADRRQGETAQQKQIVKLSEQQAAYTAREAAVRNRDEKLAAAEHAFDIKSITDADVIAAASTDPRMMYSLLVLGAGVLLLAGLTFVSHSAAHRAHQLGASGHHHEPPHIAEQIDTLVLPMASDPPSGQ